MSKLNTPFANSIRSDYERRMAHQRRDNGSFYKHASTAEQKRYTEIRRRVENKEPDYWEDLLDE